MKSNRGFIAELLMQFPIVKTYIVHADDGGSGGESAPDTAQTEPLFVQSSAVSPINYEDLIQKARTEEKNKLYGTIQKLERERDGYIEKLNTALLTIGQRDAEITRLNDELEAVRSNDSESEVVKTLRGELEAARSELQSLKDSTVDEATIRAEIEAEYRIKAYKESAIAAAGGRIIPELVSGDTEEAIDASVESAKARFEELYKNIAPPVSTPPVPAGNPAGGSAKPTNDALAALAELDPMSPEYAEARQRLGLK